MKLEVVMVPVSNVDRAKDCCQVLGWRLDARLVTARRPRLPNPRRRPGSPARTVPTEVHTMKFLESLPVYAWMTAQTTPLTGYPSDPAIARS